MSQIIHLFRGIIPRLLRDCARNRDWIFELLASISDSEHGFCREEPSQSPARNSRIDLNVLVTVGAHAVVVHLLPTSIRGDTWFCLWTTFLSSQHLFSYAFM